MAAPLRSTIPLQVTDGVYAPQEDTWLLSGVLGASGLAEGRRVLDICTGSGVLALEAAGLGAREVLAFDLCPAAVECASGNAAASGLPVEVRLGTLQDAARHGPFDLVVANPPYVPSTLPPTGTGHDRAWNAGADGRVVLDELCALAPRLIAPNGALLLVQSEFSAPRQTVQMLTDSGFLAHTAARQMIDFGPVMTARADELEASGLLEPGRRTEELVVIRAHRL
ncbi:MAG TPA: 50S ribosomal protein L11 methyltransferase [Candidatus Dietzia intestinigallinarum]|nr:50S ribosomal protein L11 methyltransferase [Candidatus Dietzia intestinigallinarum]